MNTLICAGGTGVRVLEAVLHLCAAGLGPSSLRILVIDPDRSNGNGDRSSALVERYRQGHRLFLKKLGNGVPFFRTELDLLEKGKSTGLRIWSPVSTTARLHDLLRVPLLDSTGVPQDLWKLFFSDQELNMDLREGFRARPAVGAAAMALVETQADEEPWDLLLQRLENDCNSDAGARVFLTGSIFGGTGAATLFPIGRFLRDRIAHPRLRIAGAPITPYFRFAAAAADDSLGPVPDAARSEDFPTHTKGAVDFYRHLERFDEPPFDALFWIGDSNQRTLEYAPGGTRQRNPAHIVELAAALTALEFFASPTVATGSCYTGASRTNGAGPSASEAILVWEDLPLISGSHGALSKAVLRFWLVGLVHLAFTGALVRDPRLDRNPQLVPWYWRRFARKGDSLSTEGNRLALEFLDRFFAEDHFPWWRQLQTEEAVRLANSTALPDGNGIRLDRLANLFWPDRSGDADPDAIDRFYSDLAAVPKKLGGSGGASAYLALLAHAADRFVRREYENFQAED